MIELLHVSVMGSKEMMMLWHYLEFMSTISLKFGVHTRNWPRINFQPLELSFEF